MTSPEQFANLASFWVEPPFHDPRIGALSAPVYVYNSASCAKSSSVSVSTLTVTLLWTIFVVLLVLWLLGFSLHVAGGLIHLLLVVALVVLVINLLRGRRAV